MNPVVPVAGVYRLPCFPSFVTAGFSGREFDNSKRALFLSGLGLEPGSLVTVKQVHGCGILPVESSVPQFQYVEADGLVTDKPGVTLGIRTADCVPVFFASVSGKEIGLAHGGWKGVCAGILSKMIGIFNDQYGVKSHELVVAIGPAIRSCCYEVGEEFSEYFPGFYKKEGTGKGRLDLVGKVISELKRLGVVPGSIQDTGICTVCRNASFYSYRREKQTQERILNAIALVP